MKTSNKLVYPERNAWGALPSLQSRVEPGKKQRIKPLRETHDAMPPKKGRTDPIRLLMDSNKSRMERNWFPSQYCGSRQVQRIFR